MNYRLDIQGLRAVAIVAVVIYHLNPGWLPGGFVGVDVFFVISGFLITAILNRENINKRNLVRFYTSRILRLFPAYIVMLIACVIASYIWLFPIQTTDFAQSLYSAILYVSNIYFSATINYLTIDAHLLPLLHTWSLSAEAQCYLVFPVILYILHTQKKINTGFALTALLALLFVLNLVLTAYNADIAFFSPSVRFYQFLAGAVIIFVPPRIVATRTLMRLCLVIGLVLVVSSFFIINPLIEYPGMRSLIPTVGAMLVIISGRQQQLPLAKLLTNNPMVFLGSISYSLYLWHWPVIVFYKIAVNPRLLITDYIILIGFSLLLATTSWYFVENKFRKKTNSIVVKNVLRTAIIATALIILVGSFLLSTNGLRYRYNDQQLYFAETDFSQNNRQKKTTDACMVYKNWMESFTEQSCVHVNEQKTNILLLGDSHAEHFRRALEDYSDKFSLSVAAVSGCRPTYPGTGRKTCTQMMQRFYQQLIKIYKFDVVVVSARWSNENIELMPNAINILKANINNVVILGPGISYTQSLPILLARHGTALHEFTSKAKFILYDQAKAVDQRFMKIAQDNGADYVSLVDLICPNAQCQTMTKTGVPMQWDYGHFSYDGATELVSKFASHLIQYNKSPE